MRRLKLVISCFVCSMLLFALARGVSAQPAQQAAKQHRIVVLDFSDSAVSGASQAVLGAQVDIGKGISQMLISRLTGDGTYQVIAGARVHEILKAQNVSNGAAIDAATAAKIGHMLGADAVVRAQVTQFGWDEEAAKPKSTPAESTGRNGQDAPATRKAAVEITAELIDTNSGQVLVTANSKGVSRRTGTKLLDNAPAAGGNLAMDSSGFAQSMMGEATTAAVDQLAKELEGESANLPRWAPPPLKGVITEVSSPNIAINVGRAAGLKVGNKMLVTRVVHVERDRVTDTAVGAVEDEVGVLTIVGVQDDSAVGRFNGPEPPKVGDQVRPLQ